MRDKSGKFTHKSIPWNKGLHNPFIGFRQFMNLLDKNLSGYIQCMICKGYYSSVSRHVYRAHGITAQQYRRQFPGIPLETEQSIEARRELMRRNWAKNRANMIAHITPEYRAERRDKAKEVWARPGFKSKMGEIISKSWTEERKHNYSQKMKQKYKDAGFKKNHREQTRKAVSTPEHLQRLRDQSHSFWGNVSKNKKREIMMAPRRATLPTKPERMFINLIKVVGLPYRYVGNGGFWINNLNPDFIHSKEKKVIEVFGDYWHTEGGQEGEEERKSQLAQYGWECMVIWEHELYDNSPRSIAIEVLSFTEMI